MTRRRLLSIIALVMLFTSLFSTEAAEDWCRLAVGASLAQDDDDGPCFSCRVPTDVSSADGYAAGSAYAASRQQRPSVSAPASDGSIVDEPTFSLPPSGLALVPHFTPRVIVSTDRVVYVVKTRGRPEFLDRFARPPPRGPPAS